MTEGLSKVGLIDRWLFSGAADIGTVLEMERRRALQAMQARVTAEPSLIIEMKRLDMAKRMVSEMSVCQGLAGLTPPAGYRLVSGYLIDDDHVPEPLIYAQHNFFAVSMGEPGDGHIVCLTTPQFINPYDENLSRGDRVTALKRRANGMLREIDGIAGIYALTGTSREIFKATGFRFSVYRRGNGIVLV